MVVAWLVFPLVLVLLSLGCGLLLVRASTIELSAPLLLPAGFLVLSVASLFPHMSDATASLGTPLVVVLAVAGYALAFPWHKPTIDPWWVVAALGVFAVFAAPVVLSGRATFAGFIKLDDTANYLAMIDRAVHHGYNASGLAPSTYETLLSTMYVFGYPLGAVLPLGITSALVGYDPTWLWQPYVTFLAVMVGLTLYQLATTLVRSPWLRALVAFVGAQAALIYGYALWGGIKELLTTFIVVFLATLVPTVVRLDGWRTVLPLAVGSAALVGVLTIAGAAWLAPILVAAFVLAARSRGLRPALRRSVNFLVAVGVLAIPTFVATDKWLKQYSGTYTSSNRYGNLRGRLDLLQVFGIWPNGDFRRPPADLDPTRVLVAIVGLAAVVAILVAWRRNAWEVPVAFASAAFACALYVTEGSPWIGGKALASSSPIILALALAGLAAVFERGRRVEAGVAVAFVVGGVLWSNVLQYHDVFLAPSSRLHELESIGHRFAGQGPALMTEYEEYGSRHFLRTMDAEGAGELRRHFVYLRAGGTADPGVSPDIDEIRLDAVLYYRTLVLRRSGLGSRPPSAYAPIWSGRYYTVWQRALAPRTILEHLSLGSRLQPAAVPKCAEVQRLARLAAANNGELAVVERPPAVVIEPDGSVGPPTSFNRLAQEDPKVVNVLRAATFTLSFTVPNAGTYGVWVGGSFRSKVVASVDGLRVGSDRDQLNWPSNFTSLGEVSLIAGSHVLEIRYTGPDFRPGSAGFPEYGLGPFAVVQGTEDRPVTYVRPAGAQELCGTSLDWVEAVK
jgi:hypothetical protein